MECSVVILNISKLYLALSIIEMHICLCPLDLEHCMNLLKRREELGIITKILMKTGESHFNDILSSLQCFITV